MPQSEYIPRDYHLVESKGSIPSAIHLSSGEKDTESEFNFSFEALRPSLFRITFTSLSHPLPPYPSVDRPSPSPHVSEAQTTSLNEFRAEIEVGGIKASLDWTDTPVVAISWKDSAVPIYSDLGSRSYVADGPGVAHYTQHDRNALHVGLGEKAAPMDLTGRHFIISSTDCFGYDVYKTDPMYKHIPLLIKATPDGCVGMFSTPHSRGTWSVGSEIDGLWGHFKVYRQDFGGLEEFLIVGKTTRDVVRTYAELAGFPLLNPRWAYGYVSGGYKYTMGDDPPAYQQLLDFAAKLKEHDIPCSAHQMSSGYSIAETEPKVRNVFTWNSHRFPDPRKWIAQYHSMGIKLITNIKPFVLTSHPDYEYLSESGALFTDPRTKKTAIMRLWSAGGGESGYGSHLDFTSIVAFDWWCRGVQKLKADGIDGMWNDNNEYPLANDNWTQALDNPMVKCDDPNATNFLGLWGRTLNTELMGKASHDALLQAEPHVRPFVLTRAATAGTLRYACSSWSGDNVTSWEGMKGANALSLTAGMSLLQNFGHDIGGFEGPQPSPELLLRWIQLGIYSPRFAINCFKTSRNDNSVGEVIEPWMYPEITPLVRDAIKRRYEILPYIYSLGLESHLTASPPQRWIGWGYESDPEVWSPFLKRGEEQFWFGDSMIVGGVYAPGVDKARLYLPRKNADVFDYGYVNMNAPYEYFASGQWVTIQSEWRDHVPVLARVGGAIPVGKSVQTRSPGEKDSTWTSSEEDDYRGVEIFPPRATSHGVKFSTTWFEDDGVASHPDISSFTIAYTATVEKITVEFVAHEDNIFVPLWRHLDIILHNGDERHVVSSMDVPLIKLGKDIKGRQVWRLQDVLGARQNGMNGKSLVNGC